MKKIALDNNKNVVSKSLRLCRVRCGMTQSELAAKLQTLGINMDQQMLSKIENNSRMVTDYELAGMCLALRVSPAELLTDFFREYSEHKQKQKGASSAITNCRRSRYNIIIK